MVDDLLITSKSAAAAQNRFIFYPDHLVRMPGPGQNIFEALRNIWSEPVFNGIFAGALKEFRTAKRPDSLIDESVGDFLTRRVDKRIADNLASALFHGIYAGDIYQLSAKSILPIPWMREGKHGNMVTAAVQAMTEKTSWNFCDDIALQTKLQDTVWEPKLRDQIGDASVFTFKQGLGEITKQLERRLAINKHKVRLLPSTTVTNLEKGKDSSDITVSTNASLTGLSTITDRSTAHIRPQTNGLLRPYRKQAPEVHPRHLHPIALNNPLPLLQRDQIRPLNNLNAPPALLHNEFHSRRHSLRREPLLFHPKPPPNDYSTRRSPTLPLQPPGLRLPTTSIPSIRTKPRTRPRRHLRLRHLT